MPELILSCIYRVIGCGMSRMEIWGILQRGVACNGSVAWWPGQDKFLYDFVGNATFLLRSNSDSLPVIIIPILTVYYSIYL